MKLLRLIRSLNPSAGGPVEAIRQLTPHLDALGVTTTVVSLDCPREPWLHDQPFKIIALGPVASAYGYRRGLPERIRSIALEHDRVIIHGLWQYHSLAAWRALRNSPIPYYVYTHGMLDPWFKQAYPLKHLKKWAYWPWADYRLLRDAIAVLFTSEQERLLARQSFWLYKASEVVVNYGTSAPPADAVRQRQIFLESYPELHDQQILLFLSRIHPKKGVDLLIEAFAAVAPDNPHLQLVIAGPDQVGWQASLQQRASELGISDRITWPGMLTGDLKWGAFRCASLFCLPSHQENFGIVVAEALACGLPVAIASSVNISYQVAAAGAGFVHSDTVCGTTDALLQWLTLSPSEIDRMSKCGQELFYSSFDFKANADSLLRLLNEYQ